MKDFFISYTKADKAWAEWIAWILEEAGYSVVIQAWDFRPGENFVLEMQKATLGTDKTIIVLSDNYLNASYTQPEWAAAFLVDPKSQHQKLLPIRVRSCEPKGLLAAIVYVDVAGVSEQDAQLAILGAFSTRAKPSHPPAFPGANEEPQPAVPYPGEDTITVGGNVSDSIIRMDERHHIFTATLQPHLSTTPSATVSIKERLKLARNLNAIPPQQFNMIVFALDPPPGIIPPMPAPQGDRVTALLEWAKGPSGCSLMEVQKTLSVFLNPQFEPRPEAALAVLAQPQPSAHPTPGEQVHAGKIQATEVETDQPEITPRQMGSETSSTADSAAGDSPSSTEPHPETPRFLKYLVEKIPLLTPVIERLHLFIKGRMRKRNPLLRKRTFPKRLTTWQTEKIRLVFAKQTNYAKVEFKLNNPDIEVYYNNLEVKNPVFTFNFPKDNYTQVFGLKLKKLESNAEQPVSLVCSDVAGEVLPYEGCSIKLRCRTTFPSSPSGILHILPWVVEQYIYAKWYVKYPVIAAAVILSYIVIPVLFPDQTRKAVHKIEDIRIAAIGPQRMSKWDDNFDLNRQGRWEKEAEWDYPVGRWKVVEEPGTNEETEGMEEDAANPIYKDGAMQINGSGLAVYKRPESEAFYDFVLEFIVFFPTEGENQIGWVVRADKDKQQWYGFELKKIDKSFQLQGYAHTSSGDVPLKGRVESFSLPGCCRSGDHIRIKGLIKDYDFTHWIALENPHEREPPRLTLGDETPPKGITFSAEKRWFRGRYRYGSIGLRSVSDKNDAQIIYWHTRPVVN
jgi:hypothetical protein